jgi:hypothetical protein
MERLSSNGEVIIVYFRTVGIDGDVDAVANNAVRLPYKDPSDPSFIPYDQLTEQEVLDWVFQAIGPEGKGIIERGIASQIAQKKIQVAQGVPW